MTELFKSDRFRVGSRTARIVITAADGAAPRLGIAWSPTAPARLSLLEQVQLEKGRRLALDALAAALGVAVFVGDEHHG